MIYLPKGNSVSVDLSQTSGNFIVKWFDPRLGQWIDKGIISGEMIYKFVAPDENDWVLCISLAQKM